MGLMSRTLMLFTARGAAAFEYAVTRNLLVVATPFGFAYARARDGLLDDLLRFDAMLGVGFRI
jgi:hypothetical protein